LLIPFVFTLQVRPIFNVLNHGSKFFMESGKFSIDEIMIPYYGRHSTKQFIYGKPIRFGYKVWALCASDGSGVYFEPYWNSAPGEKFNAKQHLYLKQLKELLLSAI
jgi:hypothetical protein